MSKSGHTRLSTERSDEHRRSPLRSTRRVLIVAVPPVRTLDVSGPLEVFGDANRSRSDGAIYEINIISATLMAQISAKSPLNDLLAWLPDNIQRNLSVKSLAQRAAMSPRNFARLFQQEVGRAPARYIEDLRLEAARRQIESAAMSLEEVAVSCGFTSSEILRRAFERRLGVTPRQYRACFGRGRVR